MTYRATLFTGWNLIRIEYVFEDGQLRVRRKGLLTPSQVHTVDTCGLTGEARRVWGRQPGYMAGTAVALLGLLVLGIDAVVNGAGTQLRGINWWLWAPVLGMVAVAGVVRMKTRRAAEWTHFPGRGEGKGVFILHDRRDRAGLAKLLQSVHAARSVPSA